MVQHLLEKSIFTTEQHGFTNGRSGLTNLLETFESWTEGNIKDTVWMLFSNLSL